jgi:DNA-binding transcriptional regulator YhcF (GntR family)
MRATNRTNPPVPSSRRTLAVTVAEKLASDLKASEGSSRLPPAAVLAGRYGTSPVTMLKAMQLLRERGLLDFRQGRPARLRSSRPGNTDTDSSQSRMCASVRSSILQGDLRAGTPLDKVAAYCDYYRMSRTDVCAAFRSLAEEGLIHKLGRAWIAGQKSAHSGAAAARNPVVVVVVPNPDFWNVYLYHYHFSPLFWNMLWELDRFGVDVVVALSEHQPWTGLAVSGMDEVKALVRRLGVRYRGMLLASDTANLPAWREWLSAFRTTGSPSAFFVDESGDATDARMDPLPRDCYRCFYDESRLCRFAAELLHEHGHRHGALMMNRVFSSDAWTQSRLKGMANHGLTLKPQLVLDTIAQDELFWRRSSSLTQSVVAGGDGPTAHEEPVTGNARVFTGYDSSKKELRSAVPSLASVINRREITAVVAANDDLAASYYIWFRKMGLTVGRDISILSFDNNYRKRMYPLTSVDLGFRTLGYQLAHLFIGDTRPAADRFNNIVSRPYLVDRGSLGRITGSRAS